ncbi:MAG: tripartite tricarboxylate transporter substrate binding protein, partial [Pseudomonadota bacterium]
MTSVRRMIVSAASAFALVLGAGVSLPSAAGAEEAWPEKPIRVIVPFKPGGRTDTVARLIAKEIEEEGLLSQPLVVVNMPGGGGAVAGQAVLDADDDHT